MCVRIQWRTQESFLEWVICKKYKEVLKTKENFKKIRERYVKFIYKILKN